MGHGIGESAAHELTHWIAALVLVVGGAIFLMLAARLRFASHPGSAPVAMPADTVDRSIIRIVAILSLGAAALHLAAAPHHYSELGELGAGFLIAGIFQAAWARAALRGPSTRTAWIGAVVNLAIVLAWIMSRSIGLPGGPAPWTPESIGLPDGAATVFELLIVAGLAIRLLGLDRRPLARRARVRSLAAIAVVPALGIVLLTSSLATVAIAAGVDHGVPHASPGAAAAQTMPGH